MGQTDQRRPLDGGRCGVSRRRSGDIPRHIPAAIGQPVLEGGGGPVDGQGLFHIQGAVCGGQAGSPGNCVQGKGSGAGYIDIPDINARFCVCGEVLCAVAVVLKCIFTACNNGADAQGDLSILVLCVLENSFAGDRDLDVLAEVICPLLIKNLLYHSYGNECSIEDYSIELGIAKPYVEDYVDELVYKDFLIELKNGKYLTNIALTISSFETFDECLFFLRFVRFKS